MISSYTPSYALVVTFDVDGSLDGSFNIHGFLVCHSDTSQSIAWQALDECPQTVEVVFGLPVATPIKFWAACMPVEKIQNGGRENKRNVRVPSLLQWDDYLNFWEGGKSCQINTIRLDAKTKVWLQLFVLTQLYSPLYSTFPSISLSLRSYTVKPEKQTINCNYHFIAQLADQRTPIMGVSFASGVLPVSIQRPWLSILCGARHNFYVYCFLNRLVHYDALHRTLNECALQ